MRKLRRLSWDSVGRNEQESLWQCFCNFASILLDTFLKIINLAAFPKLGVAGRSDLSMSRAMFLRFREHVFLATFLEIINLTTCKRVGFRETRKNRAGNVIERNASEIRRTSRRVTRVHARRSSARAFAERERVPRSRDPRSVASAFASALSFRSLRPVRIYRTIIRPIGSRANNSIFISRAVTVPSEISRRSMTSWTTILCRRETLSTSDWQT